MAELLQQLVNGLAVGAIYGLTALGFVLIYKATEVVNFAQGDLLMLGAFIGWTFIVPLGLPYAVAFVLTIAAMAVIGAGLDRFVMRQIIGQPHFAGIMLTIGLAFSIRGIASLVWGPQERGLPTPFTQKTTHIAGVLIPDAALAIAAGTTLLCLVLFVFFRRTRLGVAMQAASQNQLAAYLMAIPVKSVFTLTWAIAAAVAGVAGLLIAPLLAVELNLWVIVLKGFSAAVLGGFGSIPGAIVGGVLIGVAEQFVGVYIDPGAKGITAYVVLLAVLLAFPRGLFGDPQGKRV
ncbi:MAG: branched-chain amino acid ABC transporter permease [Rhodospirillaceae bacterium]|nr:branched-chain amino acid ABC transporter permease [Rhodospirillaceae bacterium]